MQMHAGTAVSCMPMHVGTVMKCMQMLHEL
jgi:hypothetical protein